MCGQIAISCKTASGTTTSLDDIAQPDSGLRTPTFDEHATPVGSDDEKDEDDDLLEDVQDEVMSPEDTPDSIAPSSPARDVSVHSPDDDGDSMASVVESELLRRFVVLSKEVFAKAL